MDNNVSEQQLDLFMLEVGQGGIWGDADDENNLVDLWKTFSLNENSAEETGGISIPVVEGDEEGVEPYYWMDDLQRDLFVGGEGNGVGVSVLGRYDLHGEGLVGEGIGREYGEMRSVELVEVAERLRNEGRVAEAVQVAEEALRREEKEGVEDLEKVKAWFVLGMAQGESDQDIKALEAFSEGVNLVEKVGSDDDREKRVWKRKALLEMAVSFTNELDENQALSALAKWLDVFGIDQSQFIVVPTTTTGSRSSSSYSINLLEKKLEQLVEGVGSSRETTNKPSQVELYTALGVLRNLGHEYDKAAEAFRSAIANQPSDARLWNKLGATLANGYNAKDALRAYRKAVDLSPNFVRAWVNVGTAYANTGDFQRAARYYLKALTMTKQRQKDSEGGNGGVGEVDGVEGTDTAHVWGYLRTTLTGMDREDLVPLIDSADPEAFRPYITF